MRICAFVGLGVCALGLLGFRDGNDAEKAQDAKSRLSGLSRMDLALWKQSLQKHGWLYGAATGKIKVIGFLTPNAKTASKNILFGKPTQLGDINYKTIMLPDTIARTWNLASKLRIAYALLEPAKYKTPPIILNAMKQIGEPKFGDFDREFKSLPVEIQQKAEDEFESYKDLAKQVKVDTYFMMLPDETIVEIGHPFNVEKVWNDYLLAKSN